MQSQYRPKPQVDQERYVFRCAGCTAEIRLYGKSGVCPNCRREIVLEHGADPVVMTGKTI
jgi:hypothetical protein